MNNNPLGEARLLIEQLVNKSPILFQDFGSEIKMTPEEVETYDKLHIAKAKKEKEEDLERNDRELEKNAALILLYGFKFSRSTNCKACGKEHKHSSSNSFSDYEYSVILHLAGWIQGLGGDFCPDCGKQRDPWKNRYSGPWGL